MSVNLKGKYIPMEYFKEYVGSVRPDEKHKISPAGEEVMPKAFPFRLVLDILGNAYFIPIIEEMTPNGKSEEQLAYSIADIVEAASGDKKKQKKIDDCHEQIKRDYQNKYAMDDKFQQRFYEIAKPTFQRDYAEAVAEGKTPMELPGQITTYNNMNPDMVTALARAARIPTGQNT